MTTCLGPKGQEPAMTACCPFLMLFAVYSPRYGRPSFCESDSVWDRAPRFRRRARRCVPGLLMGEKSEKSAKSPVKLFSVGLILAKTDSSSRRSYSGLTIEDLLSMRKTTMKMIEKKKAHSII